MGLADRTAGVGRNRVRAAFAFRRFAAGGDERQGARRNDLQAGNRQRRAAVLAGHADSLLRNGAPKIQSPVTAMRERRLCLPRPDRCYEPRFSPLPFACRTFSEASPETLTDTDDPGDWTDP